MIEININKQIKTYKGVLELKINTTFQSQSVTRISGPSGAGKTTLLKILAGLITPEAGMIRVDGSVWFDSVKKYSKHTQERKVGFVFQDYALFPNMTVEQHLRYGTDDLAYIRELLSIGEMEPLIKNYPRQLSGGQQQRLAILRALCTKPGLLLMDEPFSALDQQLKTKMTGSLKTLFSAQETTVLLVTHNEHEMSEVSDLSFEME
ncbi:sulfate/molybdate ABC transporter ATP-binding protein [Pedobacter metabolipauper]|uniref:Molybdate transport system ATP-binding protein n=1 Tax=Pedobacter metabolipauper TaxID=425513 RepID=A0A4R6SZ26_9SPHI|nr:ATP-binding cassette domain-containing protein [Pedobacter metabolipauper]TDQ11275.1 molybdate transport system ATP-binding protein [Pedobacter metabolipauper]